MELETYKSTFEQTDTVGWNAINKKLETVYGTTEPRHYAPKLHFVVGGEDPIDGISYYDKTELIAHTHLVSYGMSELYYNEEAAGKEFSKWGFEFTFRVAPFSGDEHDPFWAGEIMNNLARYVFETGNWFDEYHFIPANGPIRLETETELTGLAFVEDPELGTIDTPHGKVQFLQIVGITTNELNELLIEPSKEKVKRLLDNMRETNPLMITDLTRK